MGSNKTTAKQTIANTIFPTVNNGLENEQQPMFATLLSGTVRFLARFLFTPGGYANDSIARQSKTIRKRY